MKIKGTVHPQIKNIFPLTCSPIYPLDTYGLKETLDSGHVANLNETVLLTSLRSGEGPGRQVAAVTTAGTVIRDVRH